LHCNTQIREKTAHLSPVSGIFWTLILSFGRSNRPLQVHRPALVQGLPKQRAEVGPAFNVYAADIRLRLTVLPTWMNFRQLYGLPPENENE
jgi:hypothetical protein